MSARILIIEDNPTNLELMSYLLRAFGHDVIAAADGEEGLRAAASESPDLVVCDIQLPGVDGIEVVGRLKSDPLHAGTPVVAVTAFAMAGDRNRLLAAGFDDYISKPIDPERFIQQIERHLSARSALPSAIPVGVAWGQPPAQRSLATVLVVDDRAVNLTLMSSILEPIGYAVRTATGMGDGFASAMAAPPDLILSDLEMLEGSGFDFIAKVKAEPSLRNIPFVFITSTYCDDRSRSRGLALGAKRFLFRPIDPLVLIEEIADCLRRP